MDHYELLLSIYAVSIFPDEQCFNEVRVVHTSAKQNTSDHPCNPPRATYGVDTEPYEYMCVELLPGSATGSGNEVMIGGIESWAVLARDQQVTQGIS